MSDRETRRLSDRQLATIIDSLQITRDLVREKGLPGKDCQDVLDVLYDGMTPNTDGLTYRLGQHTVLASIADVRFEDSLDAHDHRAMQEGYDADGNPVPLPESDFDRAARYRAEAKGQA